MIDPTKSPTPAWQRYVMAGLLTALIVVVGYFVYTRDLHHQVAASGAGSKPPAAAAAPSPSASTSTTSTTLPGGIAVSTRDPFNAAP